MRALAANLHRSPFAAPVYVAALVAGMGTVLTGALLPALSRLQHLNDRQAGLLLGLQFTGAFLGATTVAASAWRSLRLGAPLAAAALVVLAAALTRSPLLLALGVLLFGYALGLVTTAVNLIVGAGAPLHRAAHLSFLNLLWSLGAALSPLLASFALSSIALPERLALPALFAAFAAAFAVLSVALLGSQPALQPQSPSASAPIPAPNLHLGAFAAFLALFLLYGGAENSLSGWVSSYAARFSAAPHFARPLMTAAFWAGLDAGRAAATLLLRRVPELRALRLATLGFILCALALLATRTPLQTALAAAACGLALAPIFPAALSWAIEQRIPPARIRWILAFCGLGASALPFLVGALSFAVSNLRLALLLPVVYGLLMLFLLVWPSSPLRHRRSSASRQRAPA